MARPAPSASQKPADAPPGVPESAGRAAGRGPDGLVNVLAGNRDIVDILPLVGGALVSAAGLRLLRRVRSN